MIRADLIPVSEIKEFQSFAPRSTSLLMRSLYGIPADAALAQTVISNCWGVVSNVAMSRFFTLTTCLLLLPLVCWARIPRPEGTEDIPYLAESASSIFHARVINIAPSDRETEWRQAGIATLAVYRWYKGDPRPSTVRLRFAYDSNSAVNGHDCVDLRRSSTWLIFANQTSPGLFEFSHDCQGGLPMASIFGPSTRKNWLQQLQQDLIAGLSDGDPAMRLANIARLGGLKLAYSPTRFISLSSTELKRNRNGRLMPRFAQETLASFRKLKA